jgi:nicotianamine synthase
MAFRTSDAAHVTRDLASYDVVFRAALMGMAVEEKARVVEHLDRHMAPSPPRWSCEARTTPRVPRP